MTAIDFPERTHVIAKDQPEYLPLPAHVGWMDEDRSIHGVTFCWKLSWKERISILFNGILWHRVLTFGKPLQPISLSTEKPKLIS